MKTPGSSFLVICFVAPGLSAQRSPSIQVIDADRGWMGAGRKLARGASLAPNTPLTAQESGDLLLNCGTSGLVSYSCRNGPCRAEACALRGEGVVVQPVNLKAAGFPDFGLTALFTRQPKAPILAVARAGGNPVDAVVRQAPDGVHWAPALNRILEGDYCFRVSHLPVEDNRRAQTFTIHWDRTVEPEGVAATLNLTPGLYLIEKGTPSADRACMLDPDATPAWVLVVPQAAFDRMNTEWKDNLARLAQLERSGAPISVVSTVRHALLASLADTIEAK